MKTIRILLFLFIVGISTSAYSQSKIGIGAQLFSPTGISVKADLNDKMAITGITSFVVSDFNNELILQANLIFKKQRPDFNIESGNLYMYYGGGLHAIFSDVFINEFSLRAPIGVEYEIAETPLGVYLDFAPTLMVDPNTVFYLTSSMGVRFYF